MIPKIKTPGTKQQYSPALMQDESEASPSGTNGRSHVNRQSTRGSAHRRRSVWLMLIVLLGVITIFALSSGGALLEKEKSVTQSSIPSAATNSATGGTAVPTTSAAIRRAQIRLYTFPPAVGLMQPAVDARGNVWVGEMVANRLARLNSHTGAVTTWEPPNAKYGIMTTIVDTHGVVWFVEQGADYIGRFDPGKQTFRTFPLGTVQGRPMGPQALQFDATGLLWFTAASAGRIGRLDPVTGAVQTWPVPSPGTGIPSVPFSLTVTPAGQVWFGDITDGAVGHLDPITGSVTLYHLADPQAQIFSMASDASGRIWFTELESGKLGMIDTMRKRVSELPVPATLGKPIGLYAVVIAHNGDVWFICNGITALVRYSPGSATFTFFQLSMPSIAPFGLTLDETGRLWFTAGGSSANAIGEMIP